MVYDVLVKEDEAYIASNQGLYRIRKNSSPNLCGNAKSKHGLLANWGNRFYVDIIKELFTYWVIRRHIVSDVRGADVHEIKSPYRKDVCSYGKVPNTFPNLYNEQVFGHLGLCGR